MGTPAPFGNAIEQCDALAQMPVRLTIGGHPEGTAAGEQPVSNRRLDQTGERIVMRQQFRGSGALFAIQGHRSTSAIR